ncbi:hypothetical protein CSUI_001487 [Cystoisospora suis]|uniref:Uncharacterized protein n=1 Tax=Cystoisospora suis TaxID=483139 RepID=A0A2C6LBJ9_9APIC|nr:hypothetical protein CSUI_001487 [Cystoisospora suis]
MRCMCSFSCLFKQAKRNLSFFLLLCFSSVNTSAFTVIFNLSECHDSFLPSSLLLSCVLS